MNNGISVEKLEEIFNFLSDDIKIKDYFPKEYELFKEMFGKAEKWDNFPSCNHSCDCTDCQIKCVRCTIQLKTGHFESDISRLRESNQELINNEEKLEQEIKQIIEDNTTLTEEKDNAVTTLKERNEDKRNLLQKLEKIETLTKTSRMMRSQLGFDILCVETKELKEILQTTKHSKGLGDK